MFYEIPNINQDYIDVEIIIKWKNTPRYSKSTPLPVGCRYSSTEAAEKESILNFCFICWKYNFLTYCNYNFYHLLNFHLIQLRSHLIKIYYG